jgi:hypothetical protein
VGGSSIAAFHPLNISYPSGIRITGFHLALPQNPSGDITWAVRAEIPPGLSAKSFQESEIFIHLLRRNGSIFQTLDIPLEQAVFSDHSPRLQQTRAGDGFETLEELNLIIGLFNHRTRLRQTPRVQIPAEARVSRQALHLHTFTAPVSGQNLPQ